MVLANLLDINSKLFLDLVHDVGLKHVEFVALPDYFASDLFVQRPFLFCVEMFLDFLLEIFNTHLVSNNKHIIEVYAQDYSSLFNHSHE